MFNSEEFKKHRKELKLSMKEVAQILGIGWQTIWAWENGKRLPSELKTRNLAKALQISVSQISDFEHEPVFSDGKLSTVSDPWFSFIDTDIDKKIQETNYIVNKIKQQNDEICKTSILVNSLITSINSIFYIKDTNLKYIIVNKAFLDNLSLPATYMTRGKDDYDFFPCQEAKVNNEQDKMVLKTGKSILNQEGIIPGTKRKKSGLISKVPIFDSFHKISGLRCTFVHMPDNAKIKKELNIQNTILKLTEEVMWCLDSKKNKFIFVTESVKNVYEIPRNRFYKNDGFIFWLNNCVHPADKDAVAKIVKTSTNKQTVDYRIITKSGSVREIQSVIFNCTYEQRPCILFSERTIHHGYVTPGYI